MAKNGRPGLRALRRRLGLTQEQVAERAGMTRVLVNKIECGHNRATKHEVRKALARGLGVSVDVLDAALQERAADATGV